MFVTITDTNGTPLPNASAWWLPEGAMSDRWWITDADWTWRDNTYEVLRRHGYAQTSDALGRVTAPDLADNHNNSGLSAVPTATGFFTISGQRLVEITPGSATPRVHLPDDHFAFVRPGPGASLLLWGAHETAARAPMWLYDPARGVAVPIAMPPGTYPMAAFYSSSRDAFGALATTSAGTDGHRIAFVPAGPARAALAAR